MLLIINKFSFLLFLLISGSLCSPSFAGRGSEFVGKFGTDDDANGIRKEGTWLNKEEIEIIHERLLRANTRDYGRYDPSPTFYKPRHKLIPN